MPMKRHLSLSVACYLKCIECSLSIEVDIRVLALIPMPRTHLSISDFLNVFLLSLESGKTFSFCLFMFFQTNFVNKDVNVKYT